MKLYHYSPDLFNHFDFSNGIHFGSAESALEAVNRKQTFCHYIYEVDLDVSNTTEVFDVGSTERWLETKRIETINGFSGVSYKNLYEPSSAKSYYVWDSSIVKLKSVVRSTPILLNSGFKFITTFSSYESKNKNKNHIKKCPKETRQFSTWSKEEDAFLIHLYGKNELNHTVFKRNYNAINQRLKFLGLIT